MKRCLKSTIAESQGTQFPIYEMGRLLPAEILFRVVQVQLIKYAHHFTHYSGLHAGILYGGDSAL